MRSFSKFFSSRGRLSRARFWLYSLFIAMAYGLLGVAEAFLKRNGAALPPAFALFDFVALCVLFWISVALWIQRLHDRNKSGSWFLIQLVPILGTIWLLVQGYCLRGTPGPNDFGDDPLSPAGADLSRHKQIASVFTATKPGA